VLGALLATPKKGRKTADPRHVLASKKTTYYPADESVVDQVVLPIDALNFEIDKTNLLGDVVCPGAKIRYR
jgi:hypothetical protein